MATYKIVSGDTLSQIAQKQGTTVSALMKANPSITDPNKIFAGQSLTLPGVSTPVGTTIPAGTNTSSSPQYTPTTGIGTRAGDYTFTDKGWVKQVVPPVVSVAPTVPTSAQYNPLTGQPLYVGQTAIKDGITYTGSTPQLPVITPETMGTNTQVPNLTQEQIQAGYRVPNLTPEQIAAGYSTIPGPYNPVTGQPWSAITGGLTAQQTADQAAADKAAADKAAAEKAATPYTTEATGLLTKIKDLLGQGDGKTAYTQEQLDISGATELAKRQRELTAQLTQVNTEATAAQQTLESQAGGRDITSSFLGRQQQEIQRQSAIKALSISSEYAANAGNLETAKENAMRAVDLKYADVEKQIEDNTKLLQLYAPFMDAEQTAQANERTLANNEAKQELADKKKAQTDLINYAQTNGDVVTASAALRLDPNSTTFVEDLARLQERMSIAPKAATPEAKKSIDYQNAETIFANNSTASYNELFNGLLQNTGLTGQEADAFLANKGKTKTGGVLGETKTATQRAKDLGYTRKQAEQAFKDDNGTTDIPTPIVEILDEVYGVSIPSDFKWWNPLTWF